MPSITGVIGQNGTFGISAEGLGGRVSELRDGYNWPSPNLSLGAGVKSQVVFPKLAPCRRICALGECMVMNLKWLGIGAIALAAASARQRRRGGKWDLQAARSFPWKQTPTTAISCTSARRTATYSVRRMRAGTGSF